MVTIGLFAITFIVVALYLLFGTVKARQLAKHISYDQGYLKLWNITQLEVMSFGSLDYAIDDEISKQLYSGLRRIIISFYIVFIPLVLAAFVSNFAGV